MATWYIPGAQAAGDQTSCFAKTGNHAIVCLRSLGVLSVTQAAALIRVGFFILLGFSKIRPWTKIASQLQPQVKIMIKSVQFVASSSWNASRLLRMGNRHTERLFSVHGKVPSLCRPFYHLQRLSIATASGSIGNRDTKEATQPLTALLGGWKRPNGRSARSLHILHHHPSNRLRIKNSSSNGIRVSPKIHSIAQID